ncbi:hypothetical protein QBC47DRAFT_125302 [Echria macrotheca]|uniref:Uncharacterized protein n=1 Tax=Echria macrotheca TaxID=438768 RepID=A0AAJ0F4A6_9PEZI|nr:hypothetical protein QBC47DRAFT_125302 [Echria macrotheca]
MNHQSSSTTVEGAYETSVENPSLWEESLERKKEDVSRLLVLLERKRQRGKVSSVHVVTLDEAIKLKDKSLFHSAVQEIATKFATKNVSKVFKQYLYPHLDHFRQFSKGVASAVQCDPTGVGSLVFGLLFIVIQCGCIFSESIETTLKQLDILQQQLPSFQEDQSMFPTNDLLKSTLQDIFCIYIDFCVTIVRNMIKKSLGMCPMLCLTIFRPSTYASLFLWVLCIRDRRNCHSVLLSPFSGNLLTVFHQWSSSGTSSPPPFSRS